MPSKHREPRRTTGRMYQCYGIPPFSVFDTRLGWWQKRKREWLALGIQSELGRGENGRAIPGGAGVSSIMHDVTAYSPSGIATSGFDPVLCELIYRWYCPPDGLVFDPFAGGSTRGIVASLCNRRYFGVDIRQEQVSANETQANRICVDPMPEWLCGDSAAYRLTREYDLIFTSPPYAGLERYSDDPRDLSTMTLEAFWPAYNAIIANAVAALKPNRFACYVVGDKRDDAGFFIGLPARTMMAFEAAGARLYNDAVLITPPGSVPIRIGSHFQRNRKLGKVHQNILIFCKGDPQIAAAEVGKIEFALPSIGVDLFSAV